MIKIGGFDVKILGATHEPGQCSLRIFMLINIASNPYNNKYKDGYPTAVGTFKKWMPFYVSSGICSGKMLAGNINPILCCCLTDNVISGNATYETYLRKWATDISRSPNFQKDANRELISRTYLKNFHKGVPSNPWIIKCDGVTGLFNRSFIKDMSLMEIKPMLTMSSEIFKRTTPENARVNHESRKRICTAFFKQINDVIKPFISYKPVPATQKLTQWEISIHGVPHMIEIIPNLEEINKLIGSNNILGINVGNIQRERYLENLVRNVLNKNSMVRRTLNYSTNARNWHRRYFDNNGPLLTIIKEGFGLPTYLELVQQVRRNILRRFQFLKKEMLNAKKRGNTKTVSTLKKIIKR